MVGSQPTKRSFAPPNHVHPRSTVLCSFLAQRCIYTPLLHTPSASLQRHTTCCASQMQEDANRFTFFFFASKMQTVSLSSPTATLIEDCGSETVCIFDAKKKNEMVICTCGKRSARGVEKRQGTTGYRCTRFTSTTNRGCIVVKRWCSTCTAGSETWLCISEG